MDARPVENAPLLHDLVEWLAAAPRPYDEVLDAWRSSCPRLSIWEDALALGFVASARDAGGERVSATDAGRAFLHAARGRPGAPPLRPLP